MIVRDQSSAKQEAKLATQSYRSRFDNTVGQNSGTAKVAPGHAPEKQPVAGAENWTPPPVTTVTLALGRDTVWGANDGGPEGNPGGNRYGGASSVNPGEKAAPARVNAMSPTDAVLSNIVRGAEAGGDDWQTRSVSSNPDCPVTYGMKPRGSSGSVPATTGTAASAPVRKP